MKLLAVFTAAACVYAADLPRCALAPGWEQKGPSRLYEGENLYEYMNGNSEGYYIYGFVRMRGVTCTKAGDIIHIDVSEMTDPELAFGMFTANRDQRRPIEKIGTGAQILPRKAIVAKGKYYLEIAAEPDKDHSANLRSIALALASEVAGETHQPAALAWFPSEGLTAGTPRLIPQSVMGIGLLKRGYLAQYENRSKAFVVTEASVTSASGVLTKLRGRFTETAVTRVAGTDEAFVAHDKYLGRLCVFRKGNRVGGYAGVPDGTDAAKLAAALAARLP